MEHLPNVKNAVIDPRKLVYCLDPDHPTGRHKARVLRSALGFRRGDEPDLERLIRAIVVRESAHRRGTTPLGEERWVVQSLMECNSGPMRLVTAWVVRPEIGVPRLVSCYLKGVKR
jgi:hypothetical protein